MFYRVNLPQVFFQNTIVLTSIFTVCLVTEKDFLRDFFKFPLHFYDDGTNKRIGYENEKIKFFKQSESYPLY